MEQETEPLAASGKLEQRQRARAEQPQQQKPPPETQKQSLPKNFPDPQPSRRVPEPWSAQEVQPVRESQPQAEEQAGRQQQPQPPNHSGNHRPAKIPDRKPDCPALLTMQPRLQPPVWRLALAPAV